MPIRKPLKLILTATGCALLAASSSSHAANLAVVAKWHRFELALTSSHTYTNALQEAEVRVLFVSPLGETNRTYGFWDGGKTWRVRFAPNFPGRWRFYTMCSDTADWGLNGQTGEFLCSAAAGDSRFDKHGPIQVARDHVHFEHADRRPFFWLGDAAWDAATRAADSDWDLYVKTRAAQKFNAVQWRLAPAAEGKTPGAFMGRERIILNLGFFKQLDAKMDALARAGLLGVIAPLWEIGARAQQILPEDQAIILLRYVVARWGGNPVAWIVAFESDSTGDQAARWQRIGRAVFNPVTHGPVIVLAGEAPWVLQEFRSESWVDALGFQTTQVTDEDGLPWLVKGPLSLERHKVPVRPLITIAPAVEAAPAEVREKSMTCDFVRRFMWSSVLINSPAGVSYAAKDIAAWTNIKADNVGQSWREALSWPGAGVIAPLAEFFEPIEFWRLRPFTAAEVVRAGSSPFSNHLVASSTEAGNLVLLYLPTECSVKVLPGPWTSAAKAEWFDPRTGQSRPAGDVGVNPTGWKFATPTTGDWVLVIQTQK